MSPPGLAPKSHPTYNANLLFPSTCQIKALHGQQGHRQKEPGSPKYDINQSLPPTLIGEAHVGEACVELTHWFGGRGGLL